MFVYQRATLTITMFLWPYDITLIKVITIYITMTILINHMVIFMGKSTISMVIFNSYVCLPEGKPYLPMIFP